LGAPPRPVMYAPQAQNLWRSTSYLAVRTTADKNGLATAVRREVAEMDKDQSLMDVAPLQKGFDDQSAQPRFQMQVMTGFGLISFVLTVMGIYGVTSYSVDQRRREIGIRMALGAAPTSIIGQVLSRGMLLTVIGIALGIGGAALAAPALRGLLIGIGENDPVTIGGVSGLLAIVSAVACSIPAMKAARVDPAITLRQE